MRSIGPAWAAFLSSLILAVLAQARPALAQAPGTTHHVQASLVADSTAIAPGQTIHVALRQQIEPHWHTYWRNSGDSGEPTDLKWDLPGGWQAGGFTWPTPRRLPVGPLMNYGYEGDVLLPMTLTAPAAAKPGQPVTLKAKARFLVCAEICVPEDADLTLTLPVTAGPAPADLNWAPQIAKVLAEAPKPGLLSATFRPKGESVALAVTGAPLKGANAAGAYFYPYAATVIDHARPEAIERGPDGLTLTMASGYDFQGGKTPASLAGVLAVGGQAYEITATPGPPMPGASGLGPAAPAALGPDARTGVSSGASGPVMSDVAGGGAPDLGL
ncbi:MAG TPA: protein-disulfide reductase DsbD domain-containing protein, partial [Phenylobacterium sp.]